MIDAIGSSSSSVNVIDNLTSNSPIAALSARQGKVVNDKIVAHANNQTDEKHIEFANTEPVDLANTGVVFLRRDETTGITPEQPTLDELKTELRDHEKKIASTTELGHIKVDGTTIKIDDTGLISAEIPIIQDATIGQKGIVQLNNTLNSTSVFEAATANAVKQINDLKANKIQPSWTTGTVGAGFGGVVRYFRDEIGFVHVYFTIYKSTSIVANEVVFSLPSGFRPFDSFNIIALGTSGTSSVPVALQFQTGGTVKVNNTTPSVSAEGIISFRGL